MGSFDEKSLVVVNAFSKVDIPKDVFESSKLHELVSGIQSDRKTVISDVERIERLRREVSDGNFVSNLVKGRKGKLQDAQLDLNSSIGSLTERSSQLLVLNTAISKLLMDQQEMLIRQQKSLEKQAAEIEKQNKEIAEHQRALSEQQDKTDKVTKGLLELTDLTSEQAVQLIDCVDRVETAEARLEHANRELRVDLENRFEDAVSVCLKRLKEISDGLSGDYSKLSQTLRSELQSSLRSADEKLSAQALAAEQFGRALAQRQAEFEQQLTSAFSTQSQHAQAELARFASETTEFKAHIEQQLQAHIQTVLEKTAAQDAAAQQLREAISAQLKKFQQDMVSAVEQKVLALRETVKGVELKQETAQQEHTQALEAQRESLERNLQHLSADLSGKAEALKNAETQLVALQAEQQKGASSNRLALAAVACLALASLGWQAAQHFALL
ncbi:hypothetical protein E5198_09405 [Pseudomonas sp. A-1]|uniref:hypothetical protein n=1 Tax=Pseudomonas sp. A-1 TaxID=1821274 RepID=UPI0010A694C8|nr:hypothetical protein [Pseudomonas sp. A-1]THG82312.1 hypothetical protein E5198_09405 [Pseudomonas sp. A-1]